MKTKPFVLFFLLLGSWVAETANAQAWSLTNDQRRAYLRYYAPILMGRTDEDVTHTGYGWMTNFDFDRDWDFSNNKAHWEQLASFVSGDPAYSNWTIRPTMYTAIIEYMDTNGTKSVTLLYHVYHAKEAHGIHDWERIEILVNKVNGTPGSGTEAVKYVVVTEHSWSKARLLGSGDLNFQVTPSGKHPMIWQAEWNGSPFDPHNQELRFVENSFSWVSGNVASNTDAKVEVNGTSGKKNVHYVFVPDSDPTAVGYWNAQTVTFANAAAMSSGKDKDQPVKWSGVKRVKYELQDLADIFPTNWEYGGYATHWRDRPTYVLLETPIYNELGVAEVANGLQLFFDIGIDDQDPTDDESNGYPDKGWFYGAYEFDGNDSPAQAMFVGDSSQPNRAAASGLYHSLGSFWWQHDYFAHNGQICLFGCGRWLPGLWYTPAAGGFDGRWVQLFND